MTISNVQWCGHCGEGVTFFCRSKAEGECAMGFGRVPVYPSREDPMSPEEVEKLIKMFETASERSPCWAQVELHRNQWAQLAVILRAHLATLDSPKVKHDVQKDSNE